MKELFNRLRKKPGLTAELLVVSCIISVLGLASPIFVMLVLSRYVAHGVDATLLTLLGGVIIAIILEFAFRQLRLRLARGVGLSSDKNTAIGAFGMLVTSRIEAMESISLAARQRLMRDLESVSSAFNASNLCAILDVPFSALFLAVLYVLNPVLGIIATLFAAGAFVYRIVSRRLLLPHVQRHEEGFAAGAGLLSTANRSPDTVRVFDPAGSLVRVWTDFTSRHAAARAQLIQKQGTAESGVVSIQALLGVIIIAVGATHVVAGTMDVGALIGANILAARALAPIARFAQLTGVMNQADDALERLQGLASLETEDGERLPSKPSQGVIELRDVSFTHAGMPSPLFESLDMKLESGAILLVKGANGAGKTSLLRLVLGLLEPGRGQVLVDGIDQRQLSPQWWRNQIAYMPQEPFFFEISIKENLLNANPGLEEDNLNAAIERAGLKRYVEESAEGLNTILAGGGSNLAVGIRRRLALARAIAQDRPVAVLDEPTEGMDADGRTCIYAAMNKLSRIGTTIIVASSDPTIEKGATAILDLDQKPKPSIQSVKQARVKTAVAK